MNTEPGYRLSLEQVQLVASSLAADVGKGDITAALIPEDVNAQATVVVREPAVVCGQAWFTEVFRQIDERMTLSWCVDEGALVAADTVLVNITGPARSLLTAEREALNWLQTLSGTATVVRRYVDAIADYSTTLLDTRKTVPGLRVAQKYAVTVGGAKNHRQGLYDAFLIKENHIMSAGSIAAAVQQARVMHSDRLVEVEVETMAECEQALAADVDVIMLDNFSIEQMSAAVELTAGRAKLEASGNITLSNLAEVAATGVDYISLGALTKHVHAVDLSLRMA